MASLVQYLQEISRLSGHELAVDVLQWRASVSTAGVVTFPAVGIGQSGQVMNLRRKDHDYYLTALQVGITTDTTTASLVDIDQLRVNFQVPNAPRPLFSTDLELSGLVSPYTGEAIPLSFDPGGIKIAGGTDLEFQVTWRGTALNTARVISAKLIATLVPKNFDQYRSK